MRRFAYSLISIASIFIISCASNTLSKNKSNDWYGLWTESSDYYNGVILRKEDGSFLKKGLQIEEIGHPAKELYMTGKWSFCNNIYILKYENCSDPQWRTILGKSINQRILLLTNNEIIYESQDGAFVTDKKIGNDSEELFNQTAVKQILR